MPISITINRVQSEAEVIAWTRGLIYWSFLNFFVVALLGLGLRSFSVFSIPFLDYKYLIHAHSHFAFGGWIMPGLLLMTVKYFPELKERIPLQTLKWISALFIFSAYGMLLSFPFMGYAPVSIAFSTINMFAGFFMVNRFWKAMSGLRGVPYLFLKAGMVFLVISAIGPIATAPMIAMGKSVSPMYTNAIYLYLHFQYNGWFTFAILAALYKILGEGSWKKGKMVFYLLALACIPAYFLSILWIRPHFIFVILGFVAASMQLIAIPLIAVDVLKMKGRYDLPRLIMTVALGFFFIKNIIQFASAFPAVVDMATSRRNFIIAYLHMVLLGFVSLFIIGSMLRANESKFFKMTKWGLFFFIPAFLVTELLLVLNASGHWLQLGDYTFPHFIFAASIFLPLGIFFIWRGMIKMG